ncbi:MAG: hypothetical protein AM1032_000372 [Mycoplasmataceae bacterium]|nr:MAG: hypothetical protein AM1032_000372 [Mycoplasmataceae bacterium]
MSNDIDSQLIEEKNKRIKENWLYILRRYREKRINLTTVFSNLSNEKIKVEQLVINDFSFDSDLPKLEKWINTAFAIVERNIFGILKEINLNNRNNVYLENVNKINNSIKEKFVLLKDNDIAKDNNLLEKIEGLILTIEMVNDQVKMLEENKQTSLNRRKSLAIERRNSLLINNKNKSENQLIFNTLNLMKETLKEDLKSNPDDYKLLKISNRINKVSSNINEVEISNLINFLKERAKENLLNWKFQSYLSHLEFFLSHWNNLDDLKDGKIKVYEKEWDELYLLSNYKWQLKEDIDDMYSNERKIVSDLRNKLSKAEANLKIQEAKVLENEQSAIRAENVENNLRQEIINEKDSYTQLQDGINERVKSAVNNAIKEELEKFNKKLKEKEEEFNKFLLKKKDELNEVLSKFQIAVDDGDDFIERIKELEVNGIDGDTGNDIVGGVWDLADAYDGKKSELEILSESLEENKEKLQRSLNERVEMEKSLKEEIKRFKDTGANYYLQLETFKEAESLKKKSKEFNKSSESLNSVDIINVDKLNNLNGEEKQFSQQELFEEQRED